MNVLQFPIKVYSFEKNTRTTPGSSLVLLNHVMCPLFLAYLVTFPLAGHNGALLEGHDGGKIQGPFVF